MTQDERLPEAGNEYRVLASDELEEVYAFSKNRWLANPKSQENLFHEWSASWRREFLEHYLKIGWSIARRDPVSGRLLGYILAQPVVFFRQHMQTVWIEYVEAESPKQVAELIEAIYKVCREKNMQRLFVRYDESDLGLGELLKTRKAKMIEEEILEFQTSNG